MPSAITIAGGAVDWSPSASPWMMLVACPVCEAREIVRTGRNRVDVKKSVMTNRHAVTPTPISAHR
jgi:hypothetical protein